MTEFHVEVYEMSITKINRRREYEVKEKYMHVSLPKSAFTIALNKNCYLKSVVLNVSI